MSVLDPIPASDFAFGHCVIQASARQLLVDGKPVRLGARAFDVLTTLVERRDHVVSKSELLDNVWPGLVVEENNLQVQVSTLRKLLGPQTIVTIPGRGYRFFRRPWRRVRPLHRLLVTRPQLSHPCRCQSAICPRNCHHYLAATPSWQRSLCCCKANIRSG